MDASVKKRLKDKCYKKAREILPQAIAVVEEEYSKPEGIRVKLSHHLLMEKLGVSSPVAWKALAMVVKATKVCIKAPTGPIYWNNDMVGLAQVFQDMFGFKPSESDLTPNTVMFTTVKRINYFP